MSPCCLGAGNIIFPAERTLDLMEKKVRVPGLRVNPSERNLEVCIPTITDSMIATKTTKIIGGEMRDREVPL